MLTLGPLAFAAPWALAALAVLPAIWWLLRVTPPSPRIQAFPPIRLLFDLVRREETPARTPLWLILFRMALAAVAILALARPLINPQAAIPATGPVLIAIDTGWASGRDWPSRRAALDQAIAQADRENRQVILLATAPNEAGDAPRAQGPLAATEAAHLAQSLQPLPWPNDRAAATAALDKVADAAHVLWIADGVGDAAARRFAEKLQSLGPLSMMSDLPERTAMVVRGPLLGDGGGMDVPVERAEASLPLPVTVEALGADGRLLGSERADFSGGDKKAQVHFNLPTEIRNELAQVRINGQSTAGAVMLLDERWRRRPVGLISGRPEGENQPLLSELFYLDRALSPFSEVRRGSIDELLDRQLSALILADVGSLSEPEKEKLKGWIAAGGVLIRFAGPRLAQNADDLVPVVLRSGDRALGGAMSWTEPAKLADFPPESPFAGLDIPADVTVKRQVLAEPTADLGQKIWAKLQDGTPLVTGMRQGRGALVLVHTTANPDWSDLALSGLFVRMLQRMVGMAQGVSEAAKAGSAALPPLLVLDGSGRLVSPPVTALPLPAENPAGELPAAARTVVGPRHPPGFYGSEEARRAFNLPDFLAVPTALDDLPSGITRMSFGRVGEMDLKPLLLGLAFLMAIIDLGIDLWLRGLLWLPQRLVRAGGAAAAMAFLLLAAPHPAAAQRQTEERAAKASSDPFIAYVLTGDTAVDQATRAGMDGLVLEVNRRTAVENAGAMPIDLEHDELAFYPLIYWPVAGTRPALSEAAHGKVNAYLRNGGLILFDTRDQGHGAVASSGPEQLQALLRGLDIPALIPVPAEHVLTKSFYLLQDFPGRFTGGTVWVEAHEGRFNDGVSSVIIGGNDWAEAWAVDSQGRPMFAVVPGGERQREMSYRFGVNLVMYALTGNYKADAVHFPHILERLGQ